MCSGDDSGNGHSHGRIPPGGRACPDTGRGRGNGQHEPNSPWGPSIMTRYRWVIVALAIVAFGCSVTAACQQQPGDDDRPGGIDTSIGPNRCADVDQPDGDCEDLDP